ncbi:MAG TPA: glutathione peroxidase [Verrucomicrobiae bacterium]|nr:glutathione peroxidase [Verrucomicrobiae bacterium]
MSLDLKGLWMGAIFFMGVMNAGAAPQNVHDFKAKTIDGKEVDLAQYDGKALLIVNTASQCGYTPQYASLEALYEKYKDAGLKVLAFPSNDFGGQEPGTDAEIKKFCDLRFKVTFDLFSKIPVKGDAMHPLYRYLTTATDFKGPITWNFNKFLVDPKGNVVARFDSKVDPLSPEFLQSVEKILPKA